MAIDAKKVLENKLMDVLIGKKNAVDELNNLDKSKVIQFDVSKDVEKRIAENHIKWANESVKNLKKAIEKLNESLAPQ